MCGFAGVLSSKAIGKDVLCDMIETQKHRGPDHQGVWLDEESGIGLAHARLSIMDLTKAGNQPMISSSGRYVISFNGEIYNHIDLRVELSESSFQKVWHGNSDTETLLAGFDTWGINKTIKKTNGMFAFAVWDRKSKTITLARDRLGEKPVYYGWQGDIFLFGSELKALKVHPSFQSIINRDALALFMRHSEVPAPYSIYENIYKLLPGSLLTVSIKNRNTKPISFWDPQLVIPVCIENQFQGSLDEASTELEEVLKNAVSGQMISDVPIGAFLSGGIDSSMIVSLMQSQSINPVKTFTIGFHESEYNEAENAKAVAQHLGTEHTELYVTSKQSLDVISLLPNLYCEPFADVSQIPTFLLSQLARHEVTVSLSGDGGDELFCGYNRHVFGPVLWNKISRLPAILRRNIAHLMLMFSPATIDKVVDILCYFLPKKLSHQHVGEKIHKLAAVIEAESPRDFYHRMVSQWCNPSELVIDSTEPQTRINKFGVDFGAECFTQQIMAMDMMTYLPDDVLTKVDRAAMGASLETRVPFLDHNVVEFAWRLPLEYKLQNGISKWLLRKVLYKYVPKELIERPKVGFSVPIDSWLRGPLREWAESLIDDGKLKREGFFYSEPIQRMWKEHLSYTRNWQYQLWNVLMFQAWLRD